MEIVEGKVLKGDDFSLLVKKKLGQGAYGNVYQVRNIKEKQDKTRLAIKQVSMQDEKQIVKCMQNEINKLCSIPFHPYVISIVNCKFQSKKHLYLIMEQYEKNLASLIKEGLPENLFVKLFYQMVNGLHHLHQQDILHLDIKPENILFKKNNMDGQFALTDFGFSSSCGDNKRCGTIYYIDPVVFKQKKRGKVNDIFSLGIVFYKAITNGNHPYFQEQVDISKQIYYYRIKESKPKILDHHQYPLAYRDIITFVNRMIQFQITKRPTLNDLIQFISKTPLFSEQIKHSCKPQSPDKSKGPYYLNQSDHPMQSLIYQQKKTTDKIKEKRSQFKERWQNQIGLFFQIHELAFKIENYYNIKNKKSLAFCLHRFNYEIFQRKCGKMRFQALSLIFGKPEVWQKLQLLHNVGIMLQSAFDRYRKLQFTYNILEEIDQAQKHIHSCLRDNSNRQLEILWKLDCIREYENGNIVESTIYFNLQKIQCTSYETGLKMLLDAHIFQKIKQPIIIQVPIIIQPHQ